MQSSNVHYYVCHEQSQFCEDFCREILSHVYILDSVTKSINSRYVAVVAAVVEATNATPPVHRSRRWPAAAFTYAGVCGQTGQVN